MRSTSRSCLAFLFLLSSACGEGSEGSGGAPKGGETSGGTSGDGGAGLGGEAGAEGGTGGTTGGSAGSGEGGSAGSGEGGSAGSGEGGSAGSANGGNAGSGKGGSAGSGNGGNAGSGNGGKGGSAGSGNGGKGGSASGGASGSAGSGGATGGTAGGGGTPSCTLAASWQTIGDFQLAAGEHSNPAAVVAAPPNRLYAVGIARMGTFQWLVRRSNDGGGTWETVDGGMMGGASDVVVDPAGRVFVVGGAAGNRIVRRSTDNGISWMTVDTIPFSSGTDPCNTGHLAVTPNGNVYAAAGCDSTGVVVHRSTDGGATWSSVDTFRYTTTTSTRMGTLGVDASGQVYVGGYGVDAVGSVHWLVRRGTGAGTWTTVDDFQLVAGGEANVATFGGTSAIYAAGYAIDAGAMHWIVRRAAAGAPSGFTTVDDVGPTQSMERLAAHGVFQASSGAFVAVGSSSVGSGPARVVYRRSADGVTWSPAGDFTYVAGQASSPAGRITEDRAGNLYGMVRGVDAQGFAHWILRKLSCN